MFDGRIFSILMYCDLSNDVGATFFFINTCAIIGVKAEVSAITKKWYLC